jgi:hypothetical protein
LKTPIVRIAKITALVAQVGAVAGSVCFAVVWTLNVIIESGIGDLLSRYSVFSLCVSASEGAVFGAMVAPITWWAFFRRVPLRRAALFTAIGTVVGSVIGDLVRPIRPYGMVGGLVAMPLGFIAGGILVRILRPDDYHRAAYGRWKIPAGARPRRPGPTLSGLRHAPPGERLSLRTDDRPADWGREERRPTSGPDSD